MQDFKKSENIISNGSFSKICSPGIRLGWIEAAPKIIASIAQSGILRSGGAVNNVMSGIIACSLQDGSLAHHINDLRNEYGNRMRIMCHYLKDNLPDGFDFQTPEGAYDLKKKIHKTLVKLSYGGNRALNRVLYYFSIFILLCIC